MKKRIISETVKKSAQIVNSIYSGELTQVTLSYARDEDIIFAIKDAVKEDLTGIDQFLNIQDIGVVGGEYYCVFSKKKSHEIKGEVIYVDFKAKKIIKKVA